MTDCLNSVDLNERNAKTSVPLHKPSDIVRPLSDIEKTMASLKAMEDKVRREVFEGGKNRGDKQVSPFAERFFDNRRRDTVDRV